MWCYFCHRFKWWTTLYQRSVMANGQLRTACGPCKRAAGGRRTARRGA